MVCFQRSQPGGFYSVSVLGEFLDSSIVLAADENLVANIRLAV